MDSCRFIVLGLALCPGGCTPNAQGSVLETSSGEAAATTDGESTGEPPAPSECPAPGAGPTMAGDVTTDATWTADGSPYIVDHNITIRATLTLEPCTQVLFAPDVGAVVRDAGRIVGHGTEAAPIELAQLEPGIPWGNIRIWQGGPLELSYTTIAGGGAVGSTVGLAAAMIDAQGVDVEGVGALRFDHVIVRDSDSQGIILRDGARFSADSAGLVATGNAGHPVNMWAQGVSTLPSGEYTGNEVDAIFLVGSGPASIAQDATIHDRGVPYIVGTPETGTQLRVTGEVASVPLLTIEPGVELAFGPGGGLHLDYGSHSGPARGALVAVGTQDAPIRFTSSAQAPAAGDWYGIYFWNEPDPRSAIEHAVVEYAGGTSQIGSSTCAWSGTRPHDGAIRFLGEPAPAGQLVTNTLIRDSAGHGIDRGWMGDLIDYQATNTFESIAFCIESYPHPLDPTPCPDPAPCPMQ